MRQGILIAAAALAAAAACTNGAETPPPSPSPSPSPTAEGTPLAQQYTSPDGTWSMRYPAGWFVEPRGDDTWFLTSFRMGNGGHLEPGQAKIDFIIRSEGEASLEAVRESLCSGEGPGEATVLSCEQIAIGDQPWIQAEIDDEAFATRTLAYGTAFEGRHLLATGFAPDGEGQDALLEAIRAIAASFELS